MPPTPLPTRTNLSVKLHYTTITHALTSVVLAVFLVLYTLFHTRWRAFSIRFAPRASFPPSFSCRIGYAGAGDNDKDGRPRSMPPWAVSFASLTLIPHIPRLSNPRLFTIAIKDFSLSHGTSSPAPRSPPPPNAKPSGHHGTDPIADPNTTLSISTSTFTAFLFPAVLRFSHGPPFKLTLDSFVLKVDDSEATPWWVCALRDNIIRVVLEGEVLRLDEMRARGEFGEGSLFPPIDRADSPDIQEADLSSSDTPPPPPTHTGMKTDSEGVSFRLTLQNYVLHSSMNERIYAFGHLRKYLVPGWDDSRGSLVIAADDCTWTKVARRPDGECTKPLWRQLLNSLLTLPRTLRDWTRDPLVTVDITVPRVQIAYTRFRIRDTELERQVVGILQRHWVADGRAGKAT